MKQTVVIAIAALLLLSNPAFGQLSCSDTLSARFDKNLKINDANGDGVVTGLEIYNDFKDNYDKDNDGCVTVKEWVDRWVSYFNFSAGFARARLAATIPDMSAACTIKYDFYQTSHISIPVPGFVSDNVQSLVDFCKSDSSLTNTNCDCSQLDGSCSSSSSINDTSACKNYLVVKAYGDICDGKGILGNRFKSNVDVNDKNGDGIITGNEIFNDFQNNYDANKDGCVTENEWNNRWENFFKFSRDFAVGRLSDITPDISAACTVSYSFYQQDASIKLPINVFIQGNVQSLVVLCQSDNDLLRTNCDCAQLLDACKKDPTISPSVPCKSYVASQAAAVVG